MGVATLGDTAPVHRYIWQWIAVDEDDFVEPAGEHRCRAQAGHAGADDHRALPVRQTSTHGAPVVLVGRS